MLVTVYIDESGTHDNSPLIMGGVGGRLGQWADFDTKWRRMLRDYKLPYFHSASLSSSKRPFRHLSIQQKRDLVHDVNKIVQRHTTWGFSAYLHKKDYDQYYIAGNRPTKIQLDTMYGVCFRMCLSFAIEMVQDVVAWKILRLSLSLRQATGTPRTQSGFLSRLRTVYRSCATCSTALHLSTRTLRPAYKVPMPSPTWEHDGT